MRKRDRWPHEQMMVGRVFSTHQPPTTERPRRLFTTDKLPGTKEYAVYEVLPEGERRMVEANFFHRAAAEAAAKRWRQDTGPEADKTCAPRSKWTPLSTRDDE